MDLYSKHIVFTYCRFIQYTYIYIYIDIGYPVSPSVAGSAVVFTSPRFIAGMAGVELMKQTMLGCHKPQEAAKSGESGQSENLKTTHLDRLHRHFLFK